MQSPLAPATSPRISRRKALLTAMASGLGCEAGPPPRAAASSAVGGSGGAGGAGDWGGLQAVTSGPLREQDRGGVAVVLLHGWGAPGDDLLSLARELARPGVRFVLPAAPLAMPGGGGGRAWWHLDRDAPAHASAEGGAPARAAHAQVQAARAGVQALLVRTRQRYAPERVVLAGFSQGAMLALDVALAGAPGVDRVAALSGVLLADSVPALKALHAVRPAVFIAHGRQDNVVPFAEGELAKGLLERHGYTVTWRPFEGGHEIPRGVVSELASFIFAAQG
jgi:phospholipase/carboxylesterase